MAKSIGNKKFVCKFCGREFVRFAGNIRGAKRYDYCSKQCATLARYKEHNNVPFPDEKTILDFWNNPINKLWIDRVIAGFVHRHPTVRPIEVRTEAMLIVAKRLRFTNDRKNIILSIKKQLWDFWAEFQLGVSYHTYQHSKPIFLEIDEMIDSLEYTTHRSIANKLDMEYFRELIEESELKCMKILKEYLKDTPREEICKKFNLKRTSDIDTSILNAVSALKKKINDEYDKPKSRLYPLLEQIKADRAGGMSLDSLAKVYQTSKSNMASFLKRYNIPAPQKNDTSRLLPELENIMADRRAGLTWLQLAMKYGSSPSNMRRLAKKYNFLG